jgi:glycerol-3-phosphate acyltransferase PlsY
VGSLSFPVFAWFFPPGPHPPAFFAVECVIALLIVVKHHTNIRRLIDGTEARAERREIA